jgi:hypothetical protein
MDSSSWSAAQSAADVAGALAPRTDEISADVCQLIVAEIPELRTDTRVIALLAASVGENVATVLHVLQHGIDVGEVRAPAAAQEYARRLAQRGVPLTSLLRAYRIGATRFQNWCLRGLAQHTDDASIVSTAGIRIAEILATYIDQVSEELVSAYEAAKESWLRNRSVARAARVRALLRGERVDVDSSEGILGYHLRQHHVGVVCWVTDVPPGGGTLARLEHATVEAAVQAGGTGRPIFVPQDESCAWAWLPFGTRDAFAIPAARSGTVDLEDGIRFAFGAVGADLPGFRRTHEQALGAHAVALAAGKAARAVTSFADVAPLALMSNSVDLVRAWVVETLGVLATDDDANARLRDTLQVFLQENGSFKAAAERLTLHKNTVQYRVRKAEESLGRPIDKKRLHLELALLASQWLSAAVLQRPGEVQP